MLPKSQGKLFLAGQRAFTANSGERTFYTFNALNPTNGDKSAFGPIFLFNDITLAANKTLRWAPPYTSFQIIFPLRGEVEFEADRHSGHADVEEILVIRSEKDKEITFKNPYVADWISFIQIGILSQSSGFLQHKCNFELGKQKNTLIPVISNHENIFSLSVGIFEGRKEAVYYLSNSDNQVFCFVIRGAFEVEGRLLHERDGLALWDTEKVEIEALSNNGIFLLLEVV